MAIARKDKLLAGYNGNLESVKIYDNAGTNKVEVTNGVFVVVEKLIVGERETKKARLASSADAGKDILFIHNSEIMYDERLNKLKDFRISADKVARAYRLHNGDIVTLTNDLFASATTSNGVVSHNLVVGDILIPTANGLLGKIGATAGSKVTFEVIEDAGFELDPMMGAVAVQVIRA
jgi:hypothetical protein